MLSLEDIKKWRKSLEITQKELSKAAGISQSMISKMEKKNANPSYNLVLKIVEFLEKYESSKEKTNKIQAKDLMSEKITSVSPDETVKKTIELMEKTGFSQIPIIENGNQIGSISTRTTPSLLLKEKNILSDKIKNHLEPSFPEVDINTSSDEILILLKNNMAVLVKKEGKIKGIISRHNLHKLVR